MHSINLSFVHPGREILASTALVKAAPELEDLCILGAVRDARSSSFKASLKWWHLRKIPVSHKDFQDMAPLSINYSMRGSIVPFWKDIMTAKVAGEVVVVKVYNKRSGGEEGFRRDLKLLSDNL